MRAGELMVSSERVTRTALRSGSFPKRFHKLQRLVGPGHRPVGDTAELTH